MSLKGVLSGQKGFITKLLEPQGIHVQAMRTRTVEESFSSYDFIYDAEMRKYNPQTKKWDTIEDYYEKTRTNEVKSLLSNHYTKYEIEIDTPKEIKTVRSGGEFRWRIVTVIYFWDTDFDEDLDSESQGE
jgi:hypothetical protein